MKKVPVSYDVKVGKYDWRICAIKCACDQGTKESASKMAEEKEISMNQYIVDSTFNKTNGTNDVPDNVPLNEVLKERLKKQDEQIERLQKALDQQQQLTLQTNQQIERLQLSEPANSEKKKGLFSRWFGS